MVIELNAQVPTNVRKLSRKEFPGAPRELHRAEIFELGRSDSVAFATGMKYAAIEAHVVSGDEIDSFEIFTDRRPEFAESRCMLNVFPSEAVNVRK